MKRSVKTNEMIIADDDFNIADYPACKAFFPVDEGSGDTLTDLVSGIVIDLATQLNGSAGASPTWSGNTVIQSATSGGRTIVGAMPDLGNTDNFFALAVVDATTDPDSMAFGVSSGVNDAIHLWDTVASLNKVADGSASDNFTSAIRDANTEVCGIFSDRVDSKFYYVEGDGAAITSPENIAIVNATGGINLGLSADSGMSLSANNILFGAAIFKFTGTPDVNDMLAIASWCNVQWRAGNKVLPPWLKNRT